MGLFISLEEPTGPMLKEAVAGGFFHSDLREKEYPKIQVRTVSQMLEGKGFELPLQQVPSYQTAQRERRSQGKQAPMAGMDNAG